MYNEDLNLYLHDEDLYRDHVVVGPEQGPSLHFGQVDPYDSRLKCGWLGRIIFVNGDCVRAIF